MNCERDRYRWQSRHWHEALVGLWQLRHTRQGLSAGRRGAARVYETWTDAAMVQKLTAPAQRSPFIFRGDRVDDWAPGKPTPKSAASASARSKNPKRLKDAS